MKYDEIGDESRKIAQAWIERGDLTDANTLAYLISRLVYDAWSSAKAAESKRIASKFARLVYDP